MKKIKTVSHVIVFIANIIDMPARIERKLYKTKAYKAITIGSKLFVAVFERSNLLNRNVSSN